MLTGSLGSDTAMIVAISSACILCGSLISFTELIDVLKTCQGEIVVPGTLC